ncbi:MAG: hypothetical protein ACE5KZ_16105 [Candidatus Scalinduaceae bacterium]
MKKIVEKTTIREAISWIIALVIITTLLTSCSSSISTVAMIPDLKSMTDIRINKSVRIMEVIGGKESVFSSGFLIESYVTNEEFKKALIATIEKSHIFKAVTDYDGDLDLYVTIKVQDYDRSFSFQVRSRLIVGYKFINKDGRLIWHESYLSEFSPAASPLSNAFTKSREGSIRENLSSFIEGISKRWPNNVD